MLRGFHLYLLDVPSLISDNTLFFRVNFTKLHTVLLGHQYGTKLQISCIILCFCFTLTLSILMLIITDSWNPFQNWQQWVFVVLYWFCVSYCGDTCSLLQQICICIDRCVMFIPIYGHMVLGCCFSSSVVSISIALELFIWVHQNAGRHVRKKRSSGLSCHQNAGRHMYRCVMFIPIYRLTNIFPDIAILEGPRQQNVPLCEAFDVFMHGYKCRSPASGFICVDFCGDLGL
jgi:hypothetical protein